MENYSELLTKYALNNENYKNWRKQHSQIFGELFSAAFSDNAEGQIHLTAALINITQRNFRAAISKLEILDRICANEHDAAVTNYFLGICYELELSYKMSEDSHKMEEHYERLKGLNAELVFPLLFHPYYRLAKFAQRESRFDDAILYYSKALAIYDGARSMPKINASLSYILYDLATVYLNMREYDKCQSCLEESEGYDGSENQHRIYVKAVLRAVQNKREESLALLGMLNDFLRPSCEAQIKAILNGTDPYHKVIKHEKLYTEEEKNMSIFDIFKRKKQDEPHAIRNDLSGAIKALVKNEILMIPNDSASASAPSASKIGGKPYLPEDFVWPTYTSPDDGEERPLSFLCQVNMNDVKKYDKDGLLPDSGMLYVFYECESMKWGFDPEDDGAASVFWFDIFDNVNFAPIDIPSEIAEEYVIPEIPLQFKARRSYPKFEEFQIYSDIECDFEEYDEALSALGVNVDEDSEDHKLLGYADIIQDEMLTECERTSRGLYCGDPESYRNTPEDVKADISKHASDWTLLLQLSTIVRDEFEFMFGDCGMLYLYIRKEDLAKREFDKARFSVQCG
ncbi:MAG: DUF1963 domain-containing protein [Ruminococcaceae bacterium]|nr:DUF1963 domain-containing protein [Oscillospiraceae bacterium]